MYFTITLSIFRCDFGWRMGRERRKCHFIVGLFVWVGTFCIVSYLFGCFTPTRRDQLNGIGCTGRFARFGGAKRGRRSCIKNQLLSHVSITIIILCVLQHNHISIMFDIPSNYSFHKPCSGCIDGVLQVFPVALNQGLDDLYRKCLRWACKHYMKVWPSRAFSQLPSELVARCKQHIIAHMVGQTVLTFVLFYFQSVLQRKNNVITDIHAVAIDFIAKYFLYFHFEMIDNRQSYVRDCGKNAKKSTKHMNIIIIMAAATTHKSKSKQKNLLTFNRIKLII